MTDPRFAAPVVADDFWHYIIGGSAAETANVVYGLPMMTLCGQQMPDHRGAIWKERAGSEKGAPRTTCPRCSASRAALYGLHEAESERELTR